MKLHFPFKCAVKEYAILANVLDCILIKIPINHRHVSKPKAQNDLLAESISDWLKQSLLCFSFLFFKTGVISQETFFSDICHVHSWIILYLVCKKKKKRKLLSAPLIVKMQQVSTSGFVCSYWPYIRYT